MGDNDAKMLAKGFVKWASCKSDRICEMARDRARKKVTKKRHKKRHQESNSLLPFFLCLQLRLRCAALRGGLCYVGVISSP
jgi:hypothetical protein